MRTSLRMLFGTLVAALLVVALWAPWGWGVRAGIAAPAAASVQLQWQAKANMLTPKDSFGTDHVAGKLYLIAGGADTGNVLEFDPRANTWATLANQTARSRLSAAFLNSASGILAIGGAVGGAAQTTVESYVRPDPSSNLTVSVLGQSMPTARYGLAAAAAGGKVYAIGGHGGPGVGILGTVEEFNGTTWAAKTAMPTPRMGLAAAAVSGKIYAIGGSVAPQGDPLGGPLGIVEEYDPVGNTWQSRASMPTPRTQLAVVAANNKIYAIGGYNGGALAIVEEYDPATNTWASVSASMTTARYALGAVFFDGKIYAMGGATSPGALSAVVEEASIIPNTPTPTLTPPPSSTPLPTLTPAPTETPTPTWTPLATVTPMETPTITPTPTVTPLPGVEVPVLPTLTYGPPATDLAALSAAVAFLRDIPTQFVSWTYLGESSVVVQLMIPTRRAVPFSTACWSGPNATAEERAAAILHGIKPVGAEAIHFFVRGTRSYVFDVSTGDYCWFDLIT